MKVTKDSFSKVSNTVKESTAGKTETPIEANLRKTNATVLECTSGRMEVSTEDSGEAIE